MIPGRGRSLGLTLAVVSLIVLVPLAAIAVRVTSISPAQFAAIVTSPRSLAAFRISLGAAFAASAIDLVVGGIVAAVLVRSQGPLARALDALVDVPFALPTAVAGITLATLYGPHGWIGSALERAGIHVAYTPAGIVLALAFVGFPFVVRTVQPVIAELPVDVHEAAASLGAAPFAILARVTIPLLVPALLTGFALALARTLGEYGSVIFIAGNAPFHTEIVPLLIVTRLEEYDDAGASAIALVSLVASLAMLFAINVVQRRISRTRGAT
jgi:sulfate transport system permease protein